MEAKEEDEIIEVLKSDYNDQFKTGLLIGTICGLTTMFLIFNLVLLI